MLWSNHFEICKWFFTRSVQHFTILVYIFMVGAYGIVGKPSWMWEIVGKPKYGVWVELTLISGNTSVACAAGPSATTSSTDFSFQNLVFLIIYLNFQRKKSLQNHYLPHSESKSYQRSSIKSRSSRSSPKAHSHFLRNFQLLFNLVFSEKIIQYSRTSTPPFRDFRPVPNTETLWT